MMVIARLRTAPLVAWQAGSLVLVAGLLGELDWGGDPLDAVRNMIFVQPLVLLGIAAVLTVWAYWLGVWRKREAYVRHDGRMLYRGSSAAWPLIAIRDVIVVRGELGVKSLRLVVDDDSEVTRELVKLYLLGDRPEVVRDAVMFAVARAGGVPVSASVH
jgi:hypothetical protein